MDKTLLLFLVLCSGLLMAQELPPVRNFAPSTYGAENQNWMVAQSQDRRMYFANTKGLLEFNGEQWYVYPTPNESIMRSVCWHDGLLYSGSYMDFGFWENNANGTLDYTSLVDTYTIPILEDEQFWNIVSTSTGVLIQSLNRIYSFDPSTKKTQIVLENDRLTKVFKVKNRIYYNIAESGLYEIVDGQSQLVISTEDLEGDVVAMGSSSSFTSFVTSTNAIFQVSAGAATKISGNQFERELTVYSAAQLKDGGYALGTISNGLVVVDEQGTVQYHMDQQSGLSNNTVLSIYNDADANLWLALDNGIDFIDIKSKYKTFIDRTGKLGTIYTALKDGSDLYLGTNQGLYLKSEGAKNFKFVTNTKGQVWTLKKIDGQIICGHNRGTYLIQGDVATQIANIEGVWDFQKLDNAPDLLLEGNYNGLNIMERSSGSWRFRNKIEGFNISSKDFVASGNLIYVSHEYKGLFELTISQDYQTVENIHLLEDLPKGINSDLIKLGTSIYYSNKHGIYIKESPSGVFLKNDQLSSLLEGPEYTSGRMVKIDDKSFWLFTKSGLQQIIIEPIHGKFEIKNFPLPQDRRSEKNGYESLVKLSEYRYLMGTAMGYLIIDTEQPEQYSKPTILNRMVLSFDNQENQLVNLNEKQRIPHGVNKLQFSVHTSEYSAFSNIEYQYRLLGLTEKWSNVSPLSILTFENLIFGNYELQVRAVVNGLPSSDYAVMEFIVEPPFYYSKVAIILYCLLLIAFIFLINLFYRWYYKKKKNSEIEKQQKELALELLQSEKNVAELKNQQLNSDIDSRNRELAVTTMAMIKKNETLNEIKSELEKLKGNGQNLDQVKEIVNKNLLEQQDWKTFEQAFSMTDKEYIKDLKERHPNLTSGDLRLSIYIRLNLSSKEIAPLLNISPRSVEIKRYRLRKKMNLKKKTDLFEYLIDI